MTNRELSAAHWADLDRLVTIGECGDCDTTERR